MKNDINKLNIIEKFVKDHYSDKNHISYDICKYFEIFGINYTNAHKILSRLFPNGYSLINRNGVVTYYKNGHLHRDNDLPAMIRGNGYRLWAKNGMIHREKGPAIIYPDGDKKWMKFDKDIFGKPSRRRRKFN